MPTTSMSILFLSVISVGGIRQEVRRVLKHCVCECTRCGERANLMEYDMVHNLFHFLPVRRWPATHPFYYCTNCRRFLSSSYSPSHAALHSSHAPPNTIVCKLSTSFNNYRLIMVFVDANRVADVVAKEGLPITPMVTLHTFPRDSILNL
ncbi:hypothetical protein Fmac_031685 [Flemingia macrophylla]|uniref:Zinc-ribbon 15 domain-containing protein n=1 Tax=Flemingia macrophylla TaxID=520843 RepID=A0ABD1L2R6_9FABA